MSAVAVASFAFSVVALFFKFVATALVQGRHRVGAKQFQYAEDARHWGGQLVADEHETVVRAQRVLRNDAEGQPLFLALGAAYVALGAWPIGAPLYFGGYVLSRVVHTVFLLHPRQPHRNRAYAFGLFCLMAIAGHVVFEAAALVR